MSILLDGRNYEIPGVTSVLCAQTTFRRPRVHPVQFIVLHSTGDAAVQGVTPGSLTPTHPLAWCDADTRESGAHTASWDATIRSDGVLLWNNDPVKYEDYHATNMNPRSMGIELAQNGPNGEIYQAQIDALVKVLDFLTVYFGIQRQIPWRNGAPDRRVMTRFTAGDGADYSGIIAHRNGDGNRSDPGDGIINALHAAGYEGYDLVAGQDKTVWVGRQRTLGVPQTGWGDTATHAALLRAGYVGGVWVAGRSWIKNALVAGALLAVGGGAWWLATRGTKVRANPDRTLLFSYGSNTPAQLAERLGHSVETGGAFLPGYVRVFRGMSQRWGGGVASLNSQSGGVTYGLVSHVSAADLDRLDQFEGVASGNYARKNIRVTLADGTKRDAVAYVSRSTEFNPPSRKYLEAVARTVNTHWKESGGRNVTWRDIDVRSNPDEVPDAEVWLVSGSDAKLREEAIEKIGAKYPAANVHVGRYVSRRSQSPERWRNFMIGDIRRQAPDAKVIVLVMSHPPKSLTKIPGLLWMNTNTSSLVKNEDVTTEDILRKMEGTQ